MNKIRKGDEVIVLAGKDKGKRGRVVLRKDDQRLVGEGISLVKKHTKPNPLHGTTRGIAEKPMPIHQSSVAILNAATGKAARVGIQVGGDKRVRVFKSSGEQIQARHVPSATALSREGRSRADREVWLQV